MHKKIQQWLFYGLLGALLPNLWHCQTTKPGNGGGPCTELGEVRDFTGLDGCRLLIVTEKGEKLLPAVIDAPGFTLEAGQRIRFSYRELTDQMSVCMAEDKIVQVTCIELADGGARPVIPACDKWDKVNPKSWLEKRLSEHGSAQIIRYPYKTDGWAYLFTGKAFYLYDCQGTLVRKGNNAEECLRGEVTDTGAGAVIYP